MHASQEKTRVAWSGDTFDFGEMVKLDVEGFRAVLDLGSKNEILEYQTGG